MLPKNVDIDLEIIQVKNKGRFLQEKKHIHPDFIFRLYILFSIEVYNISKWVIYSLPKFNN